MRSSRAQRGGCVYFCFCFVFWLYLVAVESLLSCYFGCLWEQRFGVLWQGVLIGFFLLVATARRDNPCWTNYPSYTDTRIEFSNHCCCTCSYHFPRGRGRGCGHVGENCTHPTTN